MAKRQKTKRKSQKSKPWSPPLLLPFAFCVLSFVFSSCSQKPAQAADPPPVRVAVQKLSVEPFEITIPISGTLVSTVRVDVKAETIGRVVRFDKHEGDAVAAGETVVWLDEEDRRLALRQAESAVEVAAAALERARVLEAHTTSENERAANLLKSGGITDKDLKGAQLAERDAHAQTALSSAQLDQSRAALETARKRLRDTRIHAPASGQIQARFVNPGAYVEGPTALFTLVDNRRLELESPVSSADLGPLRNGQKVTFAVNSFPGETFEGQVLEVAPAMDAQSRAAKVRIQVDNRSGRLKTGLFAQGSVITGVNAQAVVIPTAAAYRDDRSVKDSYVFVVEQGKAVRRAIRIGRDSDGRLEVVEGLRAGDLLVTQQSIELAPGVRVEALPGKP